MKSRAKSEVVEVVSSPSIGELGTERRNFASRDLDRRSALDIASIMNAEDQAVPLAVETALPQIARAIDVVADALRNGGRLFYVGSGTSGRLGALDASECPPTFDSDPEMVQCVIAGGDRALTHAVEGHEDSSAQGRRDIARRKLGPRDVVCGLSASGRTPYTVAALEYARESGVRTICVTANPGSPLSQVAGIPIVVDVGPEVLTGSTRLKAGTMQKMVINMISTGAFTRLGYVYGNLMVNVRPRNSKLAARSISILQQLTGLDRLSAEALLEVAGNSVPVAVLMEEVGVSAEQAVDLLEESKGSLRRALQNANTNRRDNLSGVKRTAQIVRTKAIPK